MVKTMENETEKVGDVPNVAKKELLSDETKFWLLVVGLHLLSIGGLVASNGWSVEAEELKDTYIFEQGQELGYNWTEHNMTVFERMMDTGLFSEAPMYEVMCSNGVKEGCDYMMSVDTAERLHGLTLMHEFVALVSLAGAGTSVLLDLLLILQFIANMKS